MHVSDTGLSDPAAYALDRSMEADWSSPAQPFGYGLVCAAAAAVLAASLAFIAVVL